MDVFCHLNNISSSFGFLSFLYSLLYSHSFKNTMTTLLCPSLYFALPSTFGVDRNTDLDETLTSFASR